MIWWNGKFTREVFLQYIFPYRLSSNDSQRTKWDISLKKMPISKEEPASCNFRGRLKKVNLDLKKKKKGMLFTVYKGDLFLWMCFFVCVFLRSHRCIFKLKMWLLALWLPGYVQAFILFSIKRRARAPLSQGWMCWSIPTVPVLWEDRGKSAEKWAAQSFSPLSW